MDMGQILKQAQQFQQKLMEIQEELAGKRVTSSVGGGMVTVSVSGKSELLEVNIDQEIIRPEEKTMLQDLIIAAVNDALKKAQEMAQAEMAKLTGGMKIPGLF